MNFDPSTSIQATLQELTQYLQQHPEHTDLVTTELNTILNKFDTQIQSGKKAPYPLVMQGFDADDTMRMIRNESTHQNLKVPDIRFFADRLSEIYQIPLPNSTRKHKEPLLLWYMRNWTTFLPQIRQWPQETKGATKNTDE